MAFMLPPDVEEFTTEGEKQFYTFLDSVAKPDTSHIAWYTPDINDREPDFLLFSENTGLVIFEVGLSLASVEDVVCADIDQAGAAQAGPLGHRLVEDDP